MAVSVLAAANAVIEMAREESVPLTNMQVQKHVFLGQGYCLALLERPLYYNDTYAWQWGPVVPKLYKALQKYGSGVVTEPVSADDQLPRDSEEYEVLRGVWEAYKRYSGAQLSALTHREGTPWSKTWDANRFGIIPQESIGNYYRNAVAVRS